MSANIKRAVGGPCRRNRKGRARQNFMAFPAKGQSRHWLKFQLEGRFHKGMASMFDDLLREHVKRQLVLKESTARQKQAALASVQKLMDLLVDSVNKNVQEVFVNQKCIEVETRALVTSVERYRKQTQQWVRMLSTFDDALKEIGDFENWTKTIGWEIETMAEVLQHMGRQSESG